MIVCKWSDLSRYESLIPGLQEAMELGVVIPIYKQMNAVIYSERIIPGSISGDLTASWTWLKDIHLLEVK